MGIVLALTAKLLYTWLGFYTVMWPLCTVTIKKGKTQLSKKTWLCLYKCKLHMLEVILQVTASNRMIV